MRRWTLVLFTTLCLTFSYAHAQEFRVAAASDLRWVMPTLVDEFVQQHPRAKGQVQVVYGSSGRLFGQIQNGAPFHLFMAADHEYAQGLVDSTHAVAPVVAYAEGGLAIWSRRQALDTDLTPGQTLLRTRGRIAIANAQHAPYGKLALAWLQSLPEWEELESRLVFAESASQSAHFVRSGSAEVGVIAEVLTYHEQMANGHQRVVAEAGRVRQAAVVTRMGAENELAQLFFEFLTTDNAQVVFRSAGFYMSNPQAENLTDE